MDPNPVAKHSHMKSRMNQSRTIETLQPLEPYVVYGVYVGIMEKKMESTI